MASSVFSRLASEKDKKNTVSSSTIPSSSVSSAKKISIFSQLASGPAPQNVKSAKDYNSYTTGPARQSSVSGGATGSYGTTPRPSVSAAQTARDDAAERLWQLNQQEKDARIERAAKRRGGSRYMGGQPDRNKGGSRYVAGSDNYGVGEHAIEIKDLKDEIRDEEYNQLIQQGYRPMSLLDATWRSLNQGYLNTRYGEESYRELGGKKNDKQKYADLLDSEEYRYVTDDPFLESLSGAAQLLGQQLRQFTNPQTAAMAATGAGAAALAGQAGPQVLAPEEVVTVPSGFFGGLKTGMALNNYQVEAGLSYNELLEKGVSPETAKKIALGVGTVNAALEGLQVDELLDAFDILKITPGTQTAAKRIAKELLDRGVDVANETLQETAQEGVTIAGTQLGSKIDKGEWAYNSGEVMNRLGDTALSSALTFGLMNVPAAGRNIAGITRDSRTGKNIKTMQEQAPVDTQTAQEAAQAQTNEMTRQAPQERTEAQRAYDTARVSRASSALGENGQKALDATYDGQTGAQQYYGGFSAYYQAGVSGQDINKVKSDFGKYLTPAQQYAAYSAGKNDAAVSLAREKEAAKFAPVAGGKSGLVYDDFVRQAVESGRTAQDVNQETRAYLTAETAERVNTLAKDLGVRVRFVDSVAGGRANAQISGSEVLVERNNQNPVMTIVGHELTHRMQQLAPEAYRSFRDLVMQEEGQSDRVQQRIADYARQGVTLDTEAAMDEVAADYAGRMMDDGKVLDDFIRKNHDNRTVLQKLRDAFRALFEKLTGKEKQQAGEAEKKLTAALEAAAAQAEQNRKNAAQTEGGEAQYSIKRATKEEISAAEQMERDGASREDIWAETGTIRDAAGNWVSEIDDSGMKYHRSGDARFSQAHLEYAEYQRLMEKMFYSELTGEEQTRLKQLDEMWGREAGRLSERVTRGNATLEDILEHDALFSVYPQLRNTRVRFENLTGRQEQASYNRKTDTITLSESLRAFCCMRYSTPYSTWKSAPPGPASPTGKTAWQTGRYSGKMIRKSPRPGSGWRRHGTRCRTS